MADEELLEMYGVVNEALPDARYRVTLDNATRNFDDQRIISLRSSYAEKTQRAVPWINPLIFGGP